MAITYPLSMPSRNKILSVDINNRIAWVQPGVINLDLSRKLRPKGFHFAPDPSSQLACAIAGNIAMNSGGAHCLKYGVTTNNLMGVTLVQMDGTVMEIGGAHKEFGQGLGIGPFPSIHVVDIIVQTGIDELLQLRRVFAVALQKGGGRQTGLKGVIGFPRPGQPVVGWCGL